VTPTTIKVVADQSPVLPRARTTRRKAVPSDVDETTRERVVNAAVSCILEQGFYRASTNEIARRAGVTWGVLQHHFGTREGLMLAVLQQGARHFHEMVETAEIDGDTVEDRLDQLLRVLARHYGTTEYIAYLQILLNLEHDPKTSNEVRNTMSEVARQTNEHVRRLLRETLGSAAKVRDLETTLFLILRGFSLSQQLLQTMSYDSPPPPSHRVARQRRLLVQVLASYAEQVADD
jgi:TetR/AcrR family transcriptional regulator, regulator of cefoperazone and chloramphenicol sensitivity